MESITRKKKRAFLADLSRDMKPRINVARVRWVNFCSEGGVEALSDGVDIYRNPQEGESSSRRAAKAARCAKHTSDFFPACGR
jgi:hypothetical protein